MTISDYVRKWATLCFHEQDAWLVRSQKVSVHIQSFGKSSVSRPKLDRWQVRKMAWIVVGIDWITQQLPITMMTAKLQGKLPRPEQAQTGVGRITVHPSEVDK